MRSPGRAGEQQRVGVQPRQGRRPARREGLERGGQAPVGVRRQITRQRLRQLGNVAGKDQGTGGGGGPPPLQDVGEELADGEDLPALVSHRHRGAVVVLGGGQHGQPRLDVGAPVQYRQVGDGRVQGGQEATESGEVAGHGLGKVVIRCRDLRLCVDDTPR